LLYGLASAALWCLCHLLIHVPRGWPFQVFGEWEILLVSLSAAAGELPPLPAGAIHGVEPGAYLVGLLAAPLIALGMSAALAGKVVALSFGAAMAALCTFWTVSLVDELHGVGPARWAGLLVAVLFACSWPGQHFDFAGMSGRTPESLLFQLLALRLALPLAGGPPLAGRSPLATPLLCGASLAIAWLFSPLALWTAAVIVVLIALPETIRGELVGGRARFATRFALGAALPFLALGLLLPEGWVGLRLFLADNLAGDVLGVAAGLVREHGDGVAAPRPGPLYLLAKVSRALEGGAHNGALAVRAGALATVAWAGLLALAWTLWQARGPAHRQLRLLAAVSLSWFIPLTLLPLDRGFYPLAYRYWSIPLAIGIMLLAVVSVAPLASSAPRLRRWGLLVALLCIALAPLPSIGRSIIAPAPSLAEAVVSAGAHGMAPRRGYPRHYAFNHLRRHASEQVQLYLSEGYGLALGADAAVTTTRGQVPLPEWHVLRGQVSAGAWRSLLRGIGCGAVAFPSQGAALAEVLLSGPDADDQDIARGVQVCAAATGSNLQLPVPLAQEAGGSYFSIAQPWALLPDRF
jgi:hypothetical protein